MESFTLNLVDMNHEQRIEGVLSFIGEDASGSFGLKANHARFMTSLSFGLSRFRLADDSWQYMALLGGIAYFNNNELSISTRHFLIDNDLERLTSLLEKAWVVEQKNLQATRTSLINMEQSLFKRLLALNRKQGG
jgi:F-type H+-transporting ATPase subunit epsilon